MPANPARMGHGRVGGAWTGRTVHRGQFLSLAKVSSPISNESQSSSNLRNEVLFWIHRQTAQRILGPVRKVPDSGGVSLALGHCENNPDSGDSISDSGKIL